ncbi:MAG: type II toxin-antitoxin system VapC family toxin [Leptolyngbyaceae cyanobacterium SM1_3_5]|nr:type II toxin-antitoxin system VapC family toxin [Leptolyngbyaceae cyanobacterium SM1_3_5]
MAERRLPAAIALKRRFDLLIQSSILQIVWVSEEIVAQAWTIFEQFNVDKQWSFTDCVSYVVMTEQSITEAFTLDRHFSQMGFLRRPL